MKTHKTLTMLSLSLSLILAVPSFAQSPGRVATTVSGISLPSSSTVSRSTSRTNSNYASPTPTSSTHNPTYSSYSNSVTSTNFNAIANKGHIETMPLAIRKGMQNGSFVAAIPQKVPTPFIPNSTVAKKSAYANVPPSQLQPRRTTGLSPQERAKVNSKYGSDFEKSTAKAPGKGYELTRPKKLYPTRHGVTRPDYKDTNFLIDAKGVNRLNLTRQLKAQQEASNGKHIIVAAPHSKVSKPILRSKTTVLYKVK